jgi:hypothetical protein
MPPSEGHVIRERSVELVNLFDVAPIHEKARQPDPGKERWIWRSRDSIRVDCDSDKWTRRSQPRKV